jgi:hypothetical protein
VDRVRSLLAQIEGGVVESITAEGANTAQAEVQARLFGIGGRGGYTHESRTEESRSLQDLTFVAFEDAADDRGLIFDLDASFADPDRWRSGEVHGRLRDGLLIRTTCPIQILDGGLFRLRVERLDKMADAILALGGEPVAPQSSSAGGSTRSRREAAEQGRRKALEEAKKLLFGGMDPNQLTAIVSFVEAFVGDSVAIRIAPCGIDQLELGFGGALLGRDEYIQREREHLFSRYGARASDWTAVCQIAAIPSRATKVEMSSDGDVVTDDAGVVNRANMERIAGEILETMEGLGIVEGPRWPSISVTPLGLYRSMPSGSGGD